MRNLEEHRNNFNQLKLYWPKDEQIVIEEFMLLHHNEFSHYVTSLRRNHVCFIPHYNEINASFEEMMIKLPMYRIVNYI